MAAFIARKILEGAVTYKKAFSFAFYKRYQEEVNEILTMEGKGDLIEE